MKNAESLHVSKEQLDRLLILAALVYIMLMFYIFEQSPKIATFYFFMLCSLAIYTLFRYTVRYTMKKTPCNCTLYKILSKMDDKITKFELLFDMSSKNNITNNKSIGIASNNESKKDKCVYNNTEYTFDMFKMSDEVDKITASLLLGVSVKTLETWRRANSIKTTSKKRPIGRPRNGKIIYEVQDLWEYHYGKGKYAELQVEVHQQGVKKK